MEGYLEQHNGKVEGNGIIAQDPQRCDPDKQGDVVEEYNAGHIPGSINIDVSKGHEELAEKLDPERPVALYCRSGRRSETAGLTLEKLFFRNVVDLKEGYNAWQESPGDN